MKGNILIDLNEGSVKADVSGEELIKAIILLEVTAISEFNITPDDLNVMKAIVILDDLSS